MNIRTRIQNDIDIWSTCLNGWGDANRISVLDTGSNIQPTITIDNDNNIYISFLQSSDLWFANSSDNGSTWSSQEVDSDLSSIPNIAVNADGDIYIIYMNGSSGDPSFWRSNSTDGGITWTVRTKLFDDSFFPSIQDSRFPTSNRMTNQLRILYTNDPDAPFIVRL